MKWKAFLILFIILVSLFPVYLLNKYFQKIIQPRKSFARLMLYLLSGFVLVFVYTFLVVLVIKKIFPGA
jgi:hypothetical protein